jgi:cation diffusion facilitator family transporter
MRAVRAARWSLGVGAAVLALKIVAWKMTGSVALFSDAMESVVNVVAAAAALVALRISRAPADENHPFGHGKAEYFSAVLEGVLIIVAAGAIAVEAVGRLASAPELVEIGPGLAVSLFATAANGGLSLYLLRRGRELRSPALEADGKHIRADVVTSVGVSLGVGLAWMTGWWVLDPILALAVAVNVVWTGWEVVRNSVGGLMDESLLPEELDTVRATIRANLGDKAIEVHDLRTRRAAAHTFIEFHLVVPGEMTVARSHDICDRLEEALAETLPGARTQIHVEPEREAEHRGRVAGPADGTDG